MKDEMQSPAEIEVAVWRGILTALAGAAPAAEYAGPDGYQARENMKDHASALRHFAAEPIAAVFRAPAWVLHAFSHWCRAWGPVQQWDATTCDEALPEGLNFRLYLAAWLWSVGIPQLSMTPADLAAVHAMTGVGPMPHPLLPLGCSEIQAGLLRTTEVDKVPAKDLTLAALADAMRRSES